MKGKEAMSPYRLTPAMPKGHEEHSQQIAQVLRSNVSPCICLIKHQPLRTQTRDSASQVRAYGLSKYL